MHNFTSRKVLLLGLPVLLLIIGYVIFRISTPDVGFTHYEPSYLPPNVSIKDKRLSLIPNRGGIVEQNFRTEDWVYSIDERKAAGPIGSAEQNYDPNSIHPTCSLFTSKENIEYRVCHWIDYGRIDVQQVKFIKGETLVRANIPSSLERPVHLEDIAKFVDSFEAKSTRGIRLHSTTSGP